MSRTTLPSLLAAGLLAACGTSAPLDRGVVAGAPLQADDLAQSDINRMATLSMQANIGSLLLLADKLYKRNPAEWRKGGFASRELALARLQSDIAARQALLALRGKRDIAALSLALAADFQADRVAAFVHASADMLIAAHGERTRFYLTDSLDAQHIYNAARNIEIAVWMLANRRNMAGQPLLLADDMNAAERNLSFEREFGKLVGRLDVLALVLTEKYRRAAITSVQTMMGATFLQFLPVR